MRKLRTTRKHRPLGAIVFIGFAALASCSYRGDIDNPATLKATWFSYLNGDDIRASCVEGAPLSYRLIYNADYDKQLRSYEAIGDASGGAHLTVRVLGESGLVLSDVTFNDPLGFARWTKQESQLEAAQVVTLDKALQASGAFGPAPEGLQLFSKETYWISNLCRDGVFSFNAWRFPSQRYEEITFDKRLFELDTTGIPVREPVAVPSTAAAKANVPRRQQSSDERGNFFNVKVGENGLTSRPAL